MPQEDNHTVDLLFRQLGNHSIPAFESLFQLLSPSLIEHSKTVLNNNESWATEVVILVFNVLWENRKKVSAMENPVGWMYKLTIRHSYNFSKSERRQKQLVNNFMKDQKMPDVFKNLESRDQSAFIYKALAQLPLKQKIIIRLSYEGWNRKEIADMTNLSESTVKNHMTKAFKSLRKILKDIRFVAI